MRIRSFIISYALVLAIVLFADRRPNHAQTSDRYSHVVDLTDGKSGRDSVNAGRTGIIAPDALIPGTWTAGQIPPERLVAPLVVMDLNVAPPSQISLDDIANWETEHGAVPQGAVVAIRQNGRLKSTGQSSQTSDDQFPMTSQAAEFLMDARYTTGFAVGNQADLNSDRAFARQVALHGNYVVEGAAGLTSLPASGSLIIVAPAKMAGGANVSAKNKQSRTTPVRVLAMVR